MESIYYVLCWHCHRRCKHCYESRFRPYIRDELEAVVAEAETTFPNIIANLPERMTFLEENPDSSKSEDYIEKTGKIILSGGDVLTEPVRERILYPVLEALQEKYQDNGGIKVVVQTTGDLLTPKIIDELLSRNIWSISVSGMDDFHVGMEGDKKDALAEKVTAMLEDAGIKHADGERDERALEKGPISACLVRAKIPGSASFGLAVEPGRTVFLKQRSKTISAMLGPVGLISYSTATQARKFRSTLLAMFTRAA